jgi:ribosomal protein L11 methyltransferase
MNYTEISLTVSPDFADILTAELAELGYESFVETDAGLNAYISETDFNQADLTELITRYQAQTSIDYQVVLLEKRNWNAEWEANYEPIEVVTELGASVRVRASFHAPDSRFQHDLVINPKMSFGTGHHETTAMMLAHQLGINHAQKRVLDVGSGTGILAILAAKLGADYALAFDIEEWAVENAIENADLNGCAAQVRVFRGTIADVSPNERFDIVLANINRNVLLAEIPVYVGLLNPGGRLVMSGFYETDAADIQQKATDSGLVLVGSKTQNQWSSSQWQVVGD